MASFEKKRLRILALWPHPLNYFHDFFPKDSDYDLEIVAGDQGKTRSPYAASWRRLLQLRGQLKRGEFDLVISCPVRRSAWPLNKRLPTRLAQAFRFFTYKHRELDTFWTPWLLSAARGRVPLAVIDYLDTSFVLQNDFPLLKASTLYFKLNLYFWPRRSLMPLENSFGMRRVLPHATKLRTMSHGIASKTIPEKVRPMRERDIDVCFTGTLNLLRSKGDIDPFPDLTSNPIRSEIHERCLKLKDRYNVVCVNRTVPKKEYLDYLQRSKLMVCTESFGCETFRHYDVAANGAIPLVNWMYAQNYMPFEPDVHAIYFSMIGDDFERTIARALSDPEKLEEISVNTRNFTIEHKQRHQLGERFIRETLCRHEALAAGKMQEGVTKLPN